MTREEAWYILRAEMVMADEGIGVSTYEGDLPGDAGILREAYRLAGEQVPEYSHWVFRDAPGLPPIKEEGP